MKTVRENKSDSLLESFIHDGGFEGKSCEEVLEILLSIAMPSVSATATAEKLLRSYHDLAAVFNAPPERLMRDFELDDGAVALLHAIPDMIKRYRLSLATKPLETANAAMKYFAAMLRNEKAEKLMACFLNEKLEVISCETISIGDIHRTASRPLALIDAANRAGSKTVIIAHNHPSQGAMASEEDIASTRIIKRALRDVGIRLLDHIIVVGDGTAVSMKNAGFFPLLDN